MKEVTVKIPNKKFSFFMELVRQLGFEAIEDISEEHISMVRERIKKSTQNPDRLMDWDTVQNSLYTG